jgi:NAD(P)-dependent dehydrogenase (short-subunit alcohol dehydrogenase family)
MPLLAAARGMTPLDRCVVPSFFACVRSEKALACMLLLPPAFGPRDALVCCARLAGLEAVVTTPKNAWERHFAFETAVLRP